MYETLLYRLCDAIRYTFGLQRATHQANGIKKALVFHRVLDAVGVTAVSAFMAPAHSRPRGPYPGATARKQQVVVPLVLRHRWPTTADEPTRRRPLDGNNYGCVITGDEDMPT